MSPTTDQILQAALALPEHEREELIEALIAASDAKGAPPFDESWRKVIAERSAQIDAGTVELIPWAEVQERLRKKVGLDG